MSEIYVSGEHHIDVGKRLTSDMTPEQVCVKNDYDGSSCCGHCSREERLKNYELAMAKRREEHRGFVLSCVLKCVMAVCALIFMFTACRSLRNISDALNAVNGKFDGVSEAVSKEQPLVDLGGIRTDLAKISDSIDSLKRSAEDVDGADGSGAAGSWENITDDGRGWLGVTVTDGSADGGPDGVVPGAIIVDLLPGSPAEKSGLKKGDLIMKINGTDIKGRDSFMDFLSGLKPGKEIVITAVSNGAAAPEDHKAVLVTLDDLNVGGEK